MVLKIPHLLAIVTEPRVTQPRVTEPRPSGSETKEKP